jgi:hypothetical protein
MHAYSGGFALTSHVILNSGHQGLLALCLLVSVFGSEGFVSNFPPW